MPSTPRAVHVLTGVLFLIGASAGAASAGPVAAWWLLVPLGAALVVGETLQVEFKYGRDVRAVDVFEAVLAPVLLLFSGPAAVALAAASKAVSQRRLRIERTKAVFNVAQWAASVGVASVLYRAVAGPSAGEVTTLPALVLALLGFAVTNELAMAAVLRVVNQVSFRRVLADLAPQYPPHAVMWSVNAALGVLFAVAVASVPVTACLLLAPLAFLRWSHQAFLSLRADRARLDGLAKAVGRLAAPVDPQDALPAFLDEIRTSFGAATVELVLLPSARVVRSGGGPGAARDDASAELARVVAPTGAIRRLGVADAEAPLAAALLAAGHRDVLAAPLLRDGEVAGALLLFDRTGFLGFEEGEDAVVGALAAMAVRAIEKSELLAVLVDERRQLAEIVGRSSDGIFTVDAAGRIESWNPAMEQMTGTRAADVLGTDGMARFEPVGTDGRLVRFGSWPAAGIPDELHITTPAGDRWLGCTSAVGGAGQTLVVVARDITRAREIDQMKDDFIATVSHELRTPLATIRGFTDLLDPGATADDDVRRQAVGRIRRGTHRLERLVANLLEVSRLEANRDGASRIAQVDLVELVRRVVDEVRDSWPERVIEVDVGSGPCSVQGAPLSIERILINLLSNALTYADAGPVRLEVRRLDGEVAVAVRDHGPGIPASQQARIFERFERLDTAKQKAGTGLGLYIASGLAAAMGAHLEVLSEPGQGAEFSLHLPVRSPDAAGALVDLPR